MTQLIVLNPNALLRDEVSVRFDVELEAEHLDGDAYNRVLAYLTQRYGSVPEAA